jgi:hypothetical protein
MGYRTQKPRVEWREDKVRMGMVLARKAIGIQPGFIPEPEAYYATLLSKVSSDLSKCFPEGSSARPPLPRDGVSVA